jgi:hypothetical protein
MEITIYEKALCCETGVCGPGVDTELLRITAAVRNIRKNGVVIRRYNLSMHPEKFMTDPLLTEALEKEGVDCLPVTITKDGIVKRKDYPTNEELALWSGLDLAKIRENQLLTF